MLVLPRAGRSAGRRSGLPQPPRASRRSGPPRPRKRSLLAAAALVAGTWTSARIESTRDDFQAPAGGELEMSASIEQPNPSAGLGYWPAFWALGSPMRAGGGWPQSGEIDMMEDVNALNEASQTLHDSANSPGHALIACPGAGSGCQTGYHTYS